MGRVIEWVSGVIGEGVVGVCEMAKEAVEALVRLAGCNGEWVEVDLDTTRPIAISQRRTDQQTD